MDTLITVVLVGFAVAFIAEFFSNLLEDWVSPGLIKKITTLPLAVGFCWVSGLVGVDLVISSPAAAFIALASLWVINRPITIQQVTTRRGA